MKASYLKGLTFLLILLFIKINLLAQDQSMRFQDLGGYGERNDIRLKCMFQDSRGLIWIGTLGGLNRWDGNRFRSYSISPFDSTGFPAMGVFSITEDNQNNLWLGTWKDGLVKYDLENEKFTHLNDTLKYPFRGNISCIKYDSAGFLWLTANGYSYRYYPEEDRAVLVEVRDSVIDKFQSRLILYDIEIDSLGITWATTNWGLYYFDRKNGVFKPKLFDLPFSYDLPPWPDDHIFGLRDMCLDKDGIIWMLWWNTELIRFNPYSKTIDFLWPRNFDSDEDSMEMIGNGGIQVDMEGLVWFSSYLGLKAYDPSTGRIIYEEDGHPVSDIMEDKDGNIIISDYEGGVILDRQGSKLKLFTMEYLDYGEGTYISNVVRNGEEYWIGIEHGGVMRLNVETGEKVYYKQNNKPGSLSHNYIWRIYKDQNDQIWIKTYNDLHMYNPENDNFKRFVFKNDSRITQNREGNFWIVEKDTVIFFDPITYKTMTIALSHSLDYIGYNSIYGLIEDSSGFLWLGGDNKTGLIRIDHRTGDWIQYQHNVNNPAGLPSDMISSMLFDSRNRIWVGTKAGLSQVITSSDTDSIFCINYFLKDGLIGEHILKLTEDISGNIWVGTNNGLSIIKTDGTIQSLTVEDGLPVRLIWHLNSDSEGRIYAGIGDLVEIPADFLQSDDNDHTPPIFFTDIQISGESIYPGDKSSLEKSILFADQVNLKYYENFIRIEFAALNYTHPEKNRYRYILKGIDVDTVEALYKSFAEYTDLKPGKYTFWATGSNNSGLWNMEGKQLSVIIHPPPWATWWAYTIYGLIIIYIIFLYQQFLIKRANEKLSLKFQEEEVNRMKELDNMKSTFFANISHEFRTPLTLILGPLESLSKGNFKGNLQREAKIMYNNGKRLIRSINQILNLSKIDADKLELKASKHNFGDFLKQIVANYDTATAEKDIALHCEIEENLEIYFDPDLMQDVINNLLSNAVKFTPNNGTIKVSLSSQKHNPQKTFIPGDGILEFRVTDTGIGIPEDQIPHVFDRFYQVDSGQTREHEGTGIGLSLVNEIVKMHHGSITVDSVEGEGAEFIVVLPTGAEHLKPEQIIEKTYKIIAEETISSEFEGTATIPSEQDEKQVESKSKALPYVLIVEDNSDMRRYIRNHLIETYRVEEAENGLVGFERAKTTIPELIVSDVMMPKMDGIQLCNRIKNEEKTRHIPVILLTAKAGKESKIEGLETGADDYISKPFDADELRIRIKNLIGQRKQLREQFSKKWILEPEEVKIESADDQFLEKVMQLIEENMSNPELTVISFGRALGMSKPQLYRKLTALTDMSPNVFIRTMRLKRAAQLFKAKEGSISEIAYQVGFSSPSYFTQCFKETFGSVPTEYS